MSAAMHTKGPWSSIRIGRDGDGSACSAEVQICNAEGEAVAIVVGDGSDEWKASVNLMASAPTLLNDRNQVIEECARHLEEAASDFVRLGNEYPEGEDRDNCYSIADTYTMAADEVRMMNPEVVARKARNLAKVKAWTKTIGTPKPTAPPWPDELETYRWELPGDNASKATGTTP